MKAAAAQVSTRQASEAGRHVAGHAPTAADSRAEHGTNRQQLQHGAARMAAHLCFRVLVTSSRHRFTMAASGQQGRSEYQTAAAEAVANRPNVRAQQELPAGCHPACAGLLSGALDTPAAHRWSCRR